MKKLKTCLIGMAIVSQSAIAQVQKVENAQTKIQKNVQSIFADKNYQVAKIDYKHSQIANRKLNKGLINRMKLKFFRTGGNVYVTAFDANDNLYVANLMFESTYATQLVASQDEGGCGCDYPTIIGNIEEIDANQDGKIDYKGVVITTHKTEELTNADIVELPNYNLPFNSFSFTKVQSPQSFKVVEGMEDDKELEVQRERKSISEIILTYVTPNTPEYIQQKRDLLSGMKIVLEVKEKRERKLRFPIETIQRSAPSQKINLRSTPELGDNIIATIPSAIEIRKDYQTWRGSSYLQLASFYPYKDLGQVDIEYNFKWSDTIVEGVYSVYDMLDFDWATGKYTTHTGPWWPVVFKDKRSGTTHKGFISGKQIQLFVL